MTPRDDTLRRARHTAMCIIGAISPTAAADAHVVYLIVRSDGSPRYIGVMRDVRKRFGQHVTVARHHNPGLAADLARGERLHAAEVVGNLAKSQAHEVECALIRFFGRQREGGPLANVRCPDDINRAAARASERESKRRQRRARGVKCIDDTLAARARRAQS